MSSGRHPGHEHDTKPPGEVVTPPPPTPGEDINIRLLGRFAFALVATIVVASGLVYAYLHFLTKTAESQDPPQSELHGGIRPVDTEYGRSLSRPDGVRLQRRPFDDIETLHREQLARLENDGWVDEKSGIAHIKIDDAMMLVVQRGLPVRGAAPVVAPPAAASATPSPSPSPAPAARPRPRTTARPAATATQTDTPAPAPAAATPEGEAN